MSRSAVASAFLVTAAFTGMFGPSAPVAAATLVRLDDYEMERLLVSGFELQRAAKVEVEAVGVRAHWSTDYASYAWILNSLTREVVWTQERGTSERVDDDRVLRKTKAELDLQPGRYEIYSWSGYNGDGDWNVRFADWNWTRKHDDGYGSRELRRAVRDCWVELRSNDVSKEDIKSFEPTGEIPGAIWRAAQLGNDTFVQAGLVIDRPTDVRIYSQCEFPRDRREAADGGWIVNTVTRERVWSMKRRDTHQAGGAEKNRVYDDDVHLDAGRYVVYYGTDDSHSYEEWNAAPPDDPLNWGITILPGKGGDASAVHVDPKYERGEPLLALTQARDGDTLEKPFKLNREAEIQVYAFGEWDDGNDEFADRAFITKANSDDVIWEMTDRNTNYGGGAEKNRLFDGTVKLAAGSYVAHYETDDSHSYRHWNSDAPYEPEAWGMTIYPSAGLSAADFTVLAEMPAKTATKEGEALARLTQVGDHARVRDRFTLTSPTTVHIYAIGEGVGGQMFDYGYIENDKTGDVVWEMTYRNTRHAGGAAKNRKFEGDVLLDAGTYVVNYETDDSHSYNDWNAGRPTDARHWGITVTKAEKEMK